jgi:tryptophanyl-tRNA synthetase
LLSLLSCATEKSIEQLVPEYEDKMYGHLKTDVADAVVSLLEPMQEKYRELRNDRAYLNEVMREGADKASERAQNTLKLVYESVGFLAKP